jgi:hypothetical protein
VFTACRIVAAVLFFHPHDRRAPPLPGG